MDPVVARCKSLTFTYSTSAEQVHALRGVDLALSRHELVVLTGSSGSGKSTLVSVLAGLEPPAGGKVEVLGHEFGVLSAQERAKVRLHHVGIVFQHNNLIAEFTARENVELVLRAQGRDDPTREASTLLAEVGIGDLAHRRASNMSGGQRQRVGIARALAGNRELVLCDEPTGALDRDNSLKLFSTLRSLAQRQGVAVLVATHDPEASDFADRHLEMIDGVLE